MLNRTPLVLALVLPLYIHAQTTISVADYGAQPDGILRTDGAIVAGSATLTSASGTFSPADVGKYIQVIGAGNGGTTNSDGVMLSGSTLLTSASGTFASTDVGRSMVVVGAGTGGQNLVTRIAGVTAKSTVSVTLADPAVSSVAAATYFYGAMTLEGTIQSVQNAGSIVLSTPAVASISNATYAYGTNFNTIFQQAVDAAGQAGGATVTVPSAANCPAGAVCGYVIAATDQMTADAPGAVKIRYNNVSLVGSDPQTNLFCRGAWGLYTNSVIFPGQTATIRGTCIALGDDGGPQGLAGTSVSNVTLSKLHLYGMTDGNTYSVSSGQTSPPLTTTGDGWDETHKAIYMWQYSKQTPNPTFSNILIDSVYIQDFKGENIYSGGSTVTGMVIQNSTLTNFNSDGISVLAASLQVMNNTMTNGSNAGVECSTTSTGPTALVQQLYQGNTFSLFPREGLVVVGSDTGTTPAGTGNNGTVQIINNNFTTIGQVNRPAMVAPVAILLEPLSSGDVPPANVTISGNTCTDCYGFAFLQTSATGVAVQTGTTQVLNNTIVVDQYSSGDLLYLSFRMNNVTIANNYGSLTPAAALAGRGVTDVYSLDWNNSTEPWTNVLIHDNSWSFPGSPNYLFITNAGPGWSAVNNQNIIWQNETCKGCTYSLNHGLADVSESTTIPPTIPPFGPVVAVVGCGSAAVNVTVDASKEQDGAELTVLNSCSQGQSIKFNPDPNIALSGPWSVPSGGSVFFRYSGPIGKFVVAQKPATISANPNATPQSALVNQAFGTALTATVQDGSNNPVEGIVVVFTAPASGAGGTFANGTNTATVLTDVNGIATAPAFTANSLASSSPSSPYTVTATASGVAASASFSLTNVLPPVSITVQTSPSGNSFTVDSVAYTSSQTFQWTPNSSHSISTTATQAGSAGTQFVFASWSNSGAISQVVVGPNAPTTYTANFNTQYQLTTSVNPTPAGTVTAGGWFNSGSGLQVQATANSGYQFSGFSGDLTGATNPQTLVMNGPHSLVANFLATQTISFGPLSAQQFPAAPFVVTATASSGLTVSFNSQTTPVCTVLVATVSLVGPGVCIIQATQAGNTTTYAAAAPVNQSFQVSVGLLQGSGTSAATAVNLTAEGSADWVHWGDGSLNRKAGVIAQLSTYTKVGTGTVAAYNNDPRTVSWADGNPTLSSSNNRDGLFINGIGQGFWFTAPADLTPRTLVVHVGGYNSAGTLTAHLSDGSAADFTDSPTNTGGQYDRNYTLTYQAASAGQTLKVTWSMASGGGNVTLNAAALQGGSSGTGSIVASAGTPQSATVSTVFTTALQATVTSGGTPVSGATVTFTAPGSGATGTFGGSATATTTTNSSGVAIAPTLTANAAAGGYTVTASVAGVTTPASFSLTNSPSTVTTGGGSLAGSGTSANTMVNLTTEGTTDWIHWGDGSLNRKAGVTAQLSTYTLVAGGAPNTYNNDPRPISWSDGTPTGSSSNNQDGLFAGGTGQGFWFTAPADTTQRTLVVHVGGYNSGGALTAILSDGSAPNFTDTTAAANGQYDRNYTLTYQAASAGQTLKVVWSMASGSGNVTLNAAALEGGSSVTESIVASAGTPQSATVSTAFTTALQATVTSGGTPVSGATVTFTAPGSGASGTFGGSATAAATTNASGVATAPAFTANASAGGYTVTASVAGVTTPASFSLTNTPVTTGGGSLRGSGTSATTAVNLTTEGSLDWVHWGDTSLNRKAGVTAQLSTYTKVGTGTAEPYNNDPRTLSWTDGTPTGISSNNRDGLYINGTGQGFSFTAPADTTQRTLVVHVGGYNSGGTLTALLSDGSAASFTDTTAAASGQYDRNYTLIYSAASAGQTLTVTWKMSSGSGNVTLSAAGLQ